MIALREGWWWPEIDRNAHGVIMGDALTDVPALLKFIPGRDLIIQAGGNVGVYPIALAEHFGTVFSVEPDALNHQCMQKNIVSRRVKNIAYRRAAFGNEPHKGCIEIVDAKNVGAHRIKPGGGDVDIMRIDDFPVSHCDAIWLDIEGFELLALKGAEQTIRKFSPIICIEDKGLSEHFGIRPGEAQTWLKTLDYEEIARIGRDKVFRRSQ